MNSWVRMRRFCTAVLAVLLTAGTAAAQDVATVSGRVTNESGSPLSGVQVVVTHQATGVQRGTLSDADGRYRVAGLRAGGPYRIEARMIGYGTGVEEGIRLAAGETRTVDFELGSQAVSIDAIEVFAERAVERQTPVAYTDVEKVEIEQRLASRDIPLVLNTTPSVYATAQGGGAGDARVNVRGFSQRNVAVMINGVPVNDMENGWVYWSNWDGIGDASQSIQMQRGLSAVNLATPSIGGTLNIVTDPASMEPGVEVKQEYGSGNFLKTTVIGSTGLVNDKFSLTAVGVRKTADGVVNGAWTDAWAYYLAASYKINDTNRLDFFALGAPQRHGQNLYKQNIAAYSHEFAKELGYSDEALAAFPEMGRDYNQNVSSVSCSYEGEQAVSDSRFQRHDCSILNERENFYHKPQVNLNWYSQLSDDLMLSTVAYYSGGEGGGTGTYGDMVWDYSGASRVVDWDATIAQNQASDSGSLGILRNSRNNQWTIGAISKLKYQLSDEVTTEIGVDWRTAEIEHYREVRDLLGGDHWIKTADEFNPNEPVGLGDKIAYNFTNTVDWLGSYAQGEYSNGRTSLYGMAGVSTIKYSYTNHFKKGPDGGELFVESDNILGYQVKGGGLYNINDRLGVFANAGYVSKVPIFDGVIDDYAGQMNPDPKNEKFISLEAGAEYRSLDGRLAGKLNLYRTLWKDRTLTRGVILEDGTEGLVSLLGLNALHQGVELEVAYQPTDLVRFDVAASLGDWYYTDDVSGTYRPDDRSTETETYEFYVKDLKVGDAPQTQVAYAVMLFPVEGMYVQAVGKTFARHYAAFSPFDRTDNTDRTQSWRAPDYTVFDLHAGYDLPLDNSPVGARVFAHVFNVLDEIYVQDAVDNSPYNAFSDNGKTHSADDAEVFLGLPRTFNIGVELRY